jgi:hypothetical protein
MKRAWAFCSLLFLLASGTAFSTTVIPLSFDRIFSDADLIFVGEVVALQSSWETRAESRSIVTLVTFDVSAVLKGQVGLRTQLTFLGGTIGDLTEQVSDMPQFKIGDRDVLFVSPERYAASPLVGFSQGRFRVQTDASGNSVVRTFQGRPLLLGLGNGLVTGLSADERGPLSLADFEALVRNRVRATASGK